MAITKEIENDKIEVVNKWNIQVRTATIIKEDGTEISRSFHRRTITCESDVSSESEEIKKIAEIYHTSSLKADYEKFKEELDAS